MTRTQNKNGSQMCADPLLSSVMLDGGIKQAKKNTERANVSR